MPVHVMIVSKSSRFPLPSATGRPITNNETNYNMNLEDTVGSSYCLTPTGVDLTKRLNTKM